MLIVVPYRDREAHMRQFVPHVRAYFARDSLARTIDYGVLVVEQEAGLPFNAGLLRNAGFALGAGAFDYVCFHDVDYLPMWADYRWCESPTPILWHGAGMRPVAPGQSAVVVKHDLEQLFGGVLLVPKQPFVDVDGYSNAYWGWGYEDIDLRERFVRAGIALGRRRGTFIALGHRNAGYELTGAPNAIARLNGALFDRKRASPDAAPDGLSTNAFEVLDRQPIADAPEPERAALWERVVVRPHLSPSPEQLAACLASG